MNNYNINITKELRGFLGLLYMFDWKYIARDEDGDIYIYNIDGHFVGKYSSDDNGFCKIIIENNGVYIVRNKKFNFKVIL